MKRADLEHIIRAASAITNEYEIMVIGSQSILGSLPNAPAELLVSEEADIYPIHKPERWDLIDGAIGEGSPFHDTFGFYAQGVGPETATLPVGWESRLVKIQNSNTDLKIGYCLEVHDLAASKLVANREKDKHFVRALIRHNLVNTSLLLDRVNTLPVDQVQKRTMSAWLHQETKPRTSPEDRER